MSETYTGKLRHPLEYDPAKVLHPDWISEYLGEIAFQGAWWASFLSEDQDNFTAKILIPGVGSGILASAFLSERSRRLEQGWPNTDFPVSIEGFDIDQAAVDTSLAALDPYLAADSSVNASIDNGDWREPETWERFPGPYTGVVINPPYLTLKALEGIRKGYERAPRHALVDSTESGSGLGEYGYLLHYISRRLEPKPGTSIIGRFGVGIENALRMRDLLHHFFVDGGLYPTAHVNVKSFQDNVRSLSGEYRSFSAFLLEPIGMDYARDGGHLNVYQADEFIDPEIRDQIVRSSRCRTIVEHDGMIRSGYDDSILFSDTD